MFSMGRCGHRPLQKALDELVFRRWLDKKKALLMQSLFGKTNYRAALAFSTTAAKAAASWMAISDRLLRFISMPAFFRPFMNLE